MHIYILYNYIKHVSSRIQITTIYTFYTKLLKYKISIIQETNEHMNH